MIMITKKHIVMRGTPSEMAAEITCAMSALLERAEKDGQRPVIAQIIAGLPTLAGLSKAELEKGIAYFKEHLGRLKEERESAMEK